jgi:hypothetical protein
MPTAFFRACPHCRSALTYLQGVSGTTLNPRCPRCRKVVEVQVPTILSADYSRRPSAVPRS